MPWRKTNACVMLSFFVSNGWVRKTRTRRLPDRFYPFGAIRSRGSAGCRQDSGSGKQQAEEHGEVGYHMEAIRLATWSYPVDGQPEVFPRLGLPTNRELIG